MRVKARLTRKQGPVAPPQGNQPIFYPGNMKNDVQITCRIDMERFASDVSENG